MLRSSSRGATLVELLAAMVVLGLASGGIFAAFYFSRQVSYRTEGKLIAQDYAHQVAEAIRLAIGGQPGMLLVPGIYLDQNYDDDPKTPAADDPPNPCGAPMSRIGGDGDGDGAPDDPTGDGFPDTASPNVPIVAGNLRTRYNLRWRYYVESHEPAGKDPNGDGVFGARTEPPCPDPVRGRDFDGDGNADLLWTKIVVDWEPLQ